MRTLVLAFCLLAAAPSWSQVTVEYARPEAFTDGRDLEALREWIVRRAKPRLAAGERLDIVITDLDAAGSARTSRAGGQVRVVGPAQAPRIELRFTHARADGSVLAQGTRTLRDPYLMDEKALVERWLAGDHL